VAGVPSAYFGEEVMAWGRIVDGSPMTVTGKVQKVPAARARGGGVMRACLHCEQPLGDAAMPVHAECLAGGIAHDAVAGLLELVAVMLAPAVIVWAG
jgi:hypothetical protein